MLGLINNCINQFDSTNMGTMGLKAHLKKNVLFISLPYSLIAAKYVCIERLWSNRLCLKINHKRGLLSLNIL